MMSAEDQPPETRGRLLMPTYLGLGLCCTCIASDIKTREKLANGMHQLHRSTGTEKRWEVKLLTAQGRSQQTIIRGAWWRKPSSPWDCSDGTYLYISPPHNFQEVKHRNSLCRANQRRMHLLLSADKQPFTPTQLHFHLPSQMVLTG